MPSWEFPGSEPIDVVIGIAAGSVALAGEAADVTTVELHASKHSRDDGWLDDEVDVSFDGRKLVIDQEKRVGGFLRGDHSVDLTVRVPAGSRCTITTASADVSCVGELATLEAKTASGDLTAASVAGPLSVKTASGDVWLEKAGAKVSVETASGDIMLREAAGDVRATTASGDVSIGSAGGSVTAQTASGDILLSSVTAGEASVRTVSGDTKVGVAAGAGVFLDLSSLTGRIRSQLAESDGGDGVELRVLCRSVSGDIEITRAPAR